MEVGSLYNRLCIRYALFACPVNLCNISVFLALVKNLNDFLSTEMKINKIRVSESILLFVLIKPCFLNRRVSFRKFPQLCWSDMQTHSRLASCANPLKLSCHSSRAATVYCKLTAEMGIAELDGNN